MQFLWINHVPVLLVWPKSHTLWLIHNAIGATGDGQWWSWNSVYYYCSLNWSYVWSIVQSHKQPTKTFVQLAMWNSGDPFPEPNWPKWFNSHRFLKRKTTINNIWKVCLIAVFATLSRNSLVTYYVHTWTQWNQIFLSSTWVERFIRLAKSYC